MQALTALRSAGILSEIYPDLAQNNKQQKKQWKYAQKRNIRFVVTKVDHQKITLKDTQENKDFVISIKEFINNYNKSSNFC